MAKVNREHTQQGWLGMEIERTKFFMMPSLFVSCEQSLDVIHDLAQRANVKHIFLRCLQKPDGTPLGINLATDVMPLAYRLLSYGYYVSVEARSEDVTDAFVEACPDPESCAGKNFCVMLSIYFPNAEKIAPYTSLKLYPKFYTGPGVWCLDADKFIEQAHLTTWPEYEDDEVVV